MRLRSKVLLSLVVLGVLPTTATLVVFYRSMAKTYEESAAQRMQGSVAQAAQSMDEFINTRGEDLRVLSLDPMFWRATDAEISIYLTRRVSIFPYYRAFYHTDARGIIVAASAPRFIGQPLLRVLPELADIFQRATHSAPATVLATELNDEALQFVSVMADQSGKTDGVLVGQVDTRHLRRLVQAIDDRTIGDGHPVLATSAGGIALTGSSAEGRLSRGPDLLSGSVREALAAMARGETTYPSADGHRMLAGFARLQPYGDNRIGGQILVSTASYARLMAPLRARFAFVAALIGLIATVVLSLAGVFARRLALRAEALVRIARGFGSGRLEPSVIATTRDELGEVGAAFNDMAARIAARTGEVTRASEALEVENAKRREVEEALRRKHAEMRVLFDLIPAMIWFKDGTNRILRVNQRVAEAAGRPVAEIEGRPAAEVYPQAAASDFAEDVEVLRSGAPRLGQVASAPGPDGKQRWFQTDRVPYRDQDGAVIGLVVLSQDITDRKVADEELQKKTALLQSYLDCAPDGVLVMTTDNDQLIKNQRFDEVWQLPRDIADDPDRRKSLDYAVGQTKDPAQCLDKLQNMMSAADETTRDEIELLDGRVLERYAGPVRVKGGPSYGRICTFRDITARKRAEESHWRFVALVENSTEYVSMANLGGKLFYLNPAGRKMTGIAADADVGSINWRDLFDDDGWKLRSEVAIPTVRATGRWDGEIRTRNLETGQMLDLQVHAFMVKDPRTNGTLCIATVQVDITARKRAEQERETLVALLDNSPDFIGMASLDGKPFYANRAGRQMIGLEREFDVSSINITDCFDDTTAALILDTVIPATFADGQWAGEGTLRNLKTRALLPVHIHSFLVRHSVTGEPICIATVERDITDIKAAGAKLEQANRELVDLSRLAGMAEIATSVLHNVGNVLNSVNVSADRIAEKVKRLGPAGLVKVAALLREHAHDLPEFLGRDPRGKALPGYLTALVAELADPQKDVLPEVVLLRKNIEHIREIVRMQQNYARVTGLKETVALADLVDDAIRINAAAFTRHEVEVIREYSPVPSFPVEKHKVLQILVNLLSNAKDALDGERGVDSQIRVRVELDEAGTATVSVKDNGIGIPAEILGRIFQHGFTTRKEGHGFGLHSGALAAKELGGSLTAHSEGAGQGATFTLQLPCKPIERHA